MKTKKKRIKKPKTIKTFLIPILRNYSRYWPPLNEAVRLATVAPNKFKCNICKNIFKKSQKIGKRRKNFYRKDHISPIIPVSGWLGWDSFIPNLLCQLDNIQILCLECHEAKTQIENQMRKEYRKKNKE